MSKHNRPFKFKQFEVSHHRSSMKVGVDAVILGAWADVEGAKSVLDVGCGCGVISLILAQRNSEASIVGIDIHEESIAESTENFLASPWSERLLAKEVDFNRYCSSCETESVDYIISNPPYFDAGIEIPETAREKARHQGALSPEIILERGSAILGESGKIGEVVPFDQWSPLEVDASSLGLRLKRMLVMIGRGGRDPKRAFMEFAKICDHAPIIEHITLENEKGEYTPEYRRLCRDLYLKF